MTRDPDTGRAVPIGTTVRFYDPKRDAWQSVWISPMQELVQTFTGRKVGKKSSWRARRKTAIRRNGSSPRSPRTRSGGTLRRATTTARRGCSRKKCEFGGWLDGDPASRVLALHL